MDIWRSPMEALSSTCLRYLITGGELPCGLFDCCSVVDATDASVFTLDDGRSVKQSWMRYKRCFTQRDEVSGPMFSVKLKLEMHLASV